MRTRTRAWQGLPQGLLVLHRNQYGMNEIVEDEENPVLKVRCLDIMLYCRRDGLAWWCTGVAYRTVFELFLGPHAHYDLGCHRH